MRGRRLPLGHPLHPAELRALRAKQLLGTLHRQFNRWAESLGQEGVFEAVETRPYYVELTQKSTEPVWGLARASVTAGEVIYNLRAALDYTVYGLAWLNNERKAVSGTQFPIDDDPETFNLRRRGGRRSSDNQRVAAYLRKVPGHYIAAIKSYQPFEGCDWTGVLRDLSNTDKHRTPLGLSPNSNVDVREVVSTGRSDAEGREIQRAKVQLTTVVVFEAFPNLSVIDGLGRITSEVRTLVRNFASGIQVTGDQG